jgi:hypothetical protein
MERISVKKQIYEKCMELKMAVVHISIDPSCKQNKNDLKSAFSYFCFEIGHFYLRQQYF